MTRYFERKPSFKSVDHTGCIVKVDAELDANIDADEDLFQSIHRNHILNRYHFSLKKYGEAKNAPEVASNQHRFFYCSVTWSS